MTLSLMLPLLTGLMGCDSVDPAKDDVSDDTGGGTEGDSDTDSDSDSDTDTDTDADADTDTDTGTPGNIGLLSRVGSAMVGGMYAGIEDLVFYDGAEGGGELLCHISYEMVTVGPRSDCANCIWAFDLRFSNATVVVDQGACLTVTGFDASTVSALDGQSIAYGYDNDYVGHSQILMFDDGSGWAAGSYSTFDDTTAEFAYDWVDGSYAY